MTRTLLAAFAMAVRPIPSFVRYRLIASVAREISLWRWRRRHGRRPQTRPSTRGRRGARAFVFQAARPASFPGADDALNAYVPAPRTARRRP
jgi:hypothetical protein